MATSRPPPRTSSLPGVLLPFHPSVRLSTCAPLGPLLPCLRGLQLPPPLKQRRSQQGRQLVGRQGTDGRTDAWMMEGEAGDRAGGEGSSFPSFPVTSCGGSTVLPK